MDQPQLFLIDAYGFIFRAYHARARSGAPPMRTSTGIATEAVYIFHNMLRKLLSSFQPSHVAVVFEGEGPTHRETEFAAYKANRPETPADLKEQIPWVRKVLDAMRLPVLAYPGFEADDVIGAIARRAEADAVPVMIVTSVKDMMQLVSDGITILNPMKDDARYDPAGVEAFLGVPPHQVADLLALKGDAVDNIPGAPGIGEKGAIGLLQEFGSVEAALDRTAEIKRKMYRESLENNRDLVLLSKRLATIDTNVPIEWKLDDFRAQPPDEEALREVYRTLEFNSLLRELDSRAAPVEAPAGLDCRQFETAEEAAAWATSVEPGARVAFVLQRPADNELSPPLLGVSARAGEGRAVLLDQSAPVAALLSDASRSKAAYDYKAAMPAIEQSGLAIAGPLEDVMLYGFLLSADPGACALDTLAAHHLNQRLPADAAELAEIVRRLAEQLGAQVDERGLRGVYETIDCPLIPVLARMEKNGVCVDTAMLARLSAMMEGEIARLTAEIHAEAGHGFNINSPQQLGRVLFEEMKLPVMGKTGKNKAYSTAADVLEALAAAHPIAAKVLEFRQLTKLKGTYVDALPQLIHPDTGRIHTTLNQTGAATGRLSSLNPNLQNIPIRSELGREIRAAFVPCAGWRLVVADYSQIELRLLAHFSRDPLLVEAFRNGEDIHTRTASEVFGVTPLEVTPELRRNAKTVNFGIIYGQTPFGLAAQLGISREEADRYIHSYFVRYAGVRKWTDAVVKEVRSTGKTRTLFGRERPIPDINSRNPNARGFAERTAVNTPLQGTAADLIKLAMIRIDAVLAEQKLQARMLLQVHDELLFEAPPEEAEAVAALVKREMEQVHKLEVPLIVDVGIGDNWKDAK